MDDKLHKSKDRLVKKAMQYVELPKPTANFTITLMHKIEALKTKKPLVFKPLIHKKTALIILVLVIGLVLYSFYATEITSNTLFDIDKLKKLTTVSFKISTAITNSLVMIGVVLLIQLFLLKKHLRKRII